MITPARNTFFKRERVKTRGIFFVNSGPAVIAGTNISGHTLFTRKTDQAGDELMVFFAMHRGRQPDRTGIDAF